MGLGEYSNRRGIRISKFPVHKDEHIFGSSILKLHTGIFVHLNLRVQGCLIKSYPIVNAFQEAKKLIT